MKRADLISKITTHWSRFVVEVEGYNALNLYHINMHAEAFLIPVLNEIFGLSLVNLNSAERKNYPAIDLADFANRVAFQITATSTLDKIKSTIETFGRHGLSEHFDVLYVCIITQRQSSYTQQKLAEVIPEGFLFDVEKHIIDKDTLLEKINSISSTPKLELIAKLFEHEFSDVQIETRKHKFQHGYLNNEPEKLFPNLLEISFPKQFYVAETKFDEQAAADRLNSYLKSQGKSLVKKFRKEKLIRNVLRQEKVVCSDWILFEGKIFTFRNLNDLKEPLARVVDRGSIETVESDYYSEINENTSRVFKHLLRQTLIELCRTKGIEYFAERGIFRFANNSKAPKQKKLKWKGKKEAVKTVIFEMINKKEKHIICFRSLAFRASFASFGDKWYVIINPTWSFTNPGGYQTSRFESAYMAGIKRLENNNSIYNYFRFFGYFLSYADLFTTEFANLKIAPAQSVMFSPRLEEKVWRPAKLPQQPKEVESAPEVDLDVDSELSEQIFD